MTAVLVQRMAPEGIEMIVGATQDPLFGPLIACGTGGVLVDVLADTAFGSIRWTCRTPAR